MNILTYLKTKKFLSNEIKNMTMEEKLKEIDEIYILLKDIPEDLDLDLSKEVIELLEAICHQAICSGVPKEKLNKIKELIKMRKAIIKKRKKEVDNELGELFKELDNELEELLKKYKL